VMGYPKRKLHRTWFSLSGCVKLVSVIEIGLDHWTQSRSFEITRFVNMAVISESVLVAEFGPDYFFMTV